MRAKGYQIHVHNPLQKSSTLRIFLFESTQDIVISEIR